MATTDREKNEQRNRELTPQRRDIAAGRRESDPFSLSVNDLFSNPFSAMRRMHDEMDRIFGEAFGGRPGSTAAGGGLATWAPTVEVSERENELVVCAELPGLRPEDVKVEITDDALVIEGERKQ